MQIPQIRFIHTPPSMMMVYQPPSTYSCPFSKNDKFLVRPRYKHPHRTLFVASKKAKSFFPRTEPGNMTKIDGSK